MIRLITRTRLTRLQADARAADEHARQTSAELHAATDRAERAEATTDEVGVILARAMEELSAAQQELLLKDIEIRRLRQAGSMEGRTLTVLLHHGEPHTIYACRADAHADTATHGVPADGWRPAGEHPPAASEWRCEPFIYHPAANGFRRAYAPAARPVEGAA